MDTDAIKEKINQILEIIKDIPEPYKAVAFDRLLESLLAQSWRVGTGPGPDTQRHLDTEALEIHPELKAFLKSQGIEESDIALLFIADEDEIRPLYEYDIDTTKMRPAQISFALMSALRNAVRSGEFSFSMVALRETVERMGCCDQNNFRRIIFEYNRNLFTNLDNTEGIGLSSTGLKLLAETAKELIKKRREKGIPK